MLNIKNCEGNANQNYDEVSPHTLQDEYYQKNNTHYIMFDEVIEGMNDPVKSMIKFKKGEMHLNKKRQGRTYPPKQKKFIFINARS